MIKKKCIQCGKRIGIISLLVNIFLVIFKFYIGIKSGSHALMAHAFYSMQDVLSSAVILWSIHFSERKSTRKYPYGCGKIEYIASVVLSIVIIAAVIILLFFAGISVFEGPRKPGFLAVWGIVVSFFVTYILSIYLRCAGKTLNSPAIMANAHHVHLDMISSVCVGLCILITTVGIRHLDPIIAIFEAIHIIITSFEILKGGINGLMDYSLSDEENNQIHAIISSNEKVKAVSYLKTRAMGRIKQIDCEIELAQTETIEIVEKVKQDIRRTICQNLNAEYELHISIAPYAPEKKEEKQSKKAIVRVLSEYYQDFITAHTIKFEHKQIHLALQFLPQIPFESCRILMEQIRRQIGAALPERKIIVTVYQNYHG